MDAGIGQSRRRKANRDAPAGSGLDTAVSDIVGRAGLTAGKRTAIGYRFRLDKDDLTARQTAIDLSVNLNPLHLDARYARSVDVAGPFQTAAEAGMQREQVAVTLRSKMDANWSAVSRYRRDLNSGRSLLGGLGLKYRDECLLFEAAVERKFEFGGGDADNLVLFRIVFQDLGGRPSARGAPPSGRR